jgi:NAD(P)H-hydrate epimerase
MSTQYLTREAVRDIDRRAVEHFGMNSLVLMENAGRGCADLICQLGAHGPVVIFCGKGNNGGDGFVIARHLDLRGIHCETVLWCARDELQGDAASNHDIAARSGQSIHTAQGWTNAQVDEVLHGADWCVDALLGTGVVGEPRSPFDRAIDALNRATARRFAVDLPSGLDCDNGQPSQRTVRADHTGTFVALKEGFRNPDAAPWIGTVHVLDIGAPRKLTDPGSER